MQVKQFCMYFNRVQKQDFVQIFELKVVATCNSARRLFLQPDRLIVHIVSADHLFAVHQQRLDSTKSDKAGGASDQNAQF